MWPAVLLCSSVLPFSLQNVAQALLVLKDLQEVQCISADLQQVPDLVATLRKVCPGQQHIPPVDEVVAIFHTRSAATQPVRLS